MRHAPAARRILQGVDAKALAAAFRARASSLVAARGGEGARKGSAIAVDGETPRGSFDAFAERKGAQGLSAPRRGGRIALGPGGRGKEPRNPDDPRPIEAFGLKEPTKGRNRWATRELTPFPVKTRLRRMSWEAKTALRLERTIQGRNPRTR